MCLFPFQNSTSNKYHLSGLELSAALPDMASKSVLNIPCLRVCFENLSILFYYIFSAQSALFSGTPLWTTWWEPWATLTCVRRRRPWALHRISLSTPSSFKCSLLVSMEILQQVCFSFLSFKISQFCPLILQGMFWVQHKINPQHKMLSCHNNVKQINSITFA